MSMTSSALREPALESDFGHDAEGELTVPPFKGFSPSTFFKEPMHSKEGDLAIYKHDLEGKPFPLVSIPAEPVTVLWKQVPDEKGLLGGGLLESLPEHSELGLATIASLITHNLLDPNRTGRQHVLFPKELPGIVMIYRRDTDNPWHGIFFWKKSFEIDSDALVFYATPVS